MCGKFTQMASWAQVVAFSQPLVSKPMDRTYSYGPMHTPRVIRMDSNGDREFIPMRWGFSYKRNTAAVEHMHARCETIDDLPTFRDSFVNRRCIIPVATFNEGEEIQTFYQDGTPCPDKPWTRQWVISPKDEQPIFVASIWRPAPNGGPPEFVMITTEPNPLVAKITDRMPAILTHDDFDVWLGEARAPLSEVKDLLRTYDDRGNWEARIEDPTKQPPKRRKPKADGPETGSLL